ncbi:MAG: YceI family protein [Ignavibacteriales bacterium]|nr:YceI family protein [Ignavibacteriales bacterium]
MKTLELTQPTTITNIPTTWTIDPTHTKAQFSVRHLVISEVVGHFEKFEGKVISPTENFSDSRIEFTLQTNSINTDIADRDTHLKSADFFDVENFPTISFRSTSFHQISDDKYKLVGDFTIKNVTKSIELNVTYNGTIKDPWGNTRAGFQLEGSINRLDFDLKWNALMETGSAIVGKTVKILCNIEIVQQLQ